MTFIEINRVSACYIEVVVLFFRSFNISWITKCVLSKQGGTSLVRIVRQQHSEVCGSLVFDLRTLTTKHACLSYLKKLKCGDDPTPRFMTNFRFFVSQLTGPR